MVARLRVLLLLLLVPMMAQAQTVTETLQVTSLPAKTSQTACAWLDASGNFYTGACPTGTVSSVSFTDSTGLFSVAGSPVTSSGGFTLSLGNQSANTIFARSTGTGVPSFQSMLKAMMPATTVHIDQTNTFGAFLQTFGGGLTVSSGTTTTQALSSTTGTFSGAVAANAGITVDTTAFTVADITGNVSTTGTLAVSSTADLKGNVSDSTGNLTLNDSVDVLDNLVLGSATGEYAQSANFVSRSTGWQATYDGTADFREVFADQMRIKLFTVEQTQAVNGSMQWTKSVAEVAGESTVGGAVTCPTAGGATETWWFRDFPNAANLRIFQTGDSVSVRTLAWADSGSDGASEMSVTDCVMTVSAYADGTAGNDGYQSWTMTRPAGASGGSMAAAGAVSMRSPVLNYGVTLDGFLEATVHDGANNINAPYFGVKTWASSPIAANMTTRLRIGQLRGITSVDEYGLFAGVFNAVNGQYLRASDQSFDLHGIDLSLWDADSANIILRRNSGNPYFAIGNAAPTAYATGGGIWMGSDSGTYKFRVGDVSSSDYISYNGTTFTVRGDLNADDITAGSITGRTVQTAANCGTSGGACVRMNNSDFRWYTGSNVLFGIIDGTNGISLPFDNATTSNEIGYTIGDPTSGQRVRLRGWLNGGSAYSKLEVNTTAAMGQLQLITSGGSGTTQLTIDSNFTFAPLGSTTFANNVTFDTSTLFVDASANKVGIGLSSGLQNTLHVNGSIASRTATSTDGLVMLEPGTATTQGYISWYKPTPTRIAYLGYNAGVFDGDDSLMMTLEAGATFIVNGSMGVGKKPGYSLDVNGTIYGQTSVYATTGFYSQGTAGGAGTESSGYWWGGSGVAHGNIAWQPNEQTFLFRSGNTPTADTDVYGAVDLNTNGDVYASGFRVASWATLANSTNPLCTDVGNGAAGFIYRCAGNWSSRRYKQNIVPVDETWMRVLDIQPVRFQWKPEANPNRDVQYGAIAEDVEALGLTDLVKYEDGVVMGLHYDKIALALIPVVKQQQQQIEALMHRLEALEAKHP